MTAPTLHPSASTRPARYTGEVMYLYAFDVGYEIVRAPIGELLGQPVAMFQMDTSKRAPRQFFFYRPQIVALPPLERMTRRGPVRVERSVKIFPIGAFSLTIRIPFAADSIHELVDLHDLQYSNGGRLHDDVLATAEEVRQALEPYIVRPVSKLADEEAYTVFAIHAPAEMDHAKLHSAENWLEANRRQVAALLTEEYELAHLSNQEADESTSRYLSYYDHDLVVVDWDAALVIDEPKYIDETVYLMELANLQLAELEAYDRILDDVVDRAYRDLAVKRLRRVRGAARTLRDLREIRVDLARVSDELENITKFFGDWHLARIYKTVAGRFHLADWHRTIDDKLATLNELYRLLQEDRNHRTMMLLELTVVFFFLIELIPLIYAVTRH